MQVETCGKRFSTEAIVAKQNAGTPLTFGELMALRTASRTPPAPAVVKLAATPGRLALVAKHADGRETVITALQSDQTVKSAAWAQIEKLAEAECELNPTLTKADARIRAMDSPEGAPFRDFYRHPDASLSVTEWVQKQQAPARSSAARGEVLKRAADIRRKDLEISDSAAFIRALDCDPELAARYRNEQQRG